MFSWMGNKPDHPMYNAEEAKRLLADLPQDRPQKALEEVSAWFNSFRGTPGYALENRIAVAMLLDDAGQPLLAELLTRYLEEPHLQDFQGLQLWQAMHAYTKATVEALALCLAEFDAEKKPSAHARELLPVICVRLLRTLSGQMKLELLRYVDVEQDVWDGLYQHYHFAEQHGFEDAMVLAYPRQVIHTSPKRELLCALALYLSSPETLAPEQIEVGFRIAARMVSFFDLSSEPADARPWFIDLDHPLAPGHAGHEPQLSPPMRFFGLAAAIPRLNEIIEQHEQGELERERRFGSEFTPDGKLTVLKHLRQYWSDTPQHRLQERRGISTEVEVVHGFDTVGRLVPHIELDQVVGLSEDEVGMLKKRSGVGLAEVEHSYTSESWQVQDMSTAGLGVLMPQAAGNWVRIGMVCGLKGRNAGLWWVGMIRRLKTDRQNRVHAGIEILTKKPLAIWLRVLGKGAEKVSNWETSSGSFAYDYLQAILLPGADNSYDAATMLLPTGSYVQDALFEAMMGEKSRNVRLVRLLDEGDDYERVRFEWLD